MPELSPVQFAAAVAKSGLLTERQVQERMTQFTADAGIKEKSAKALAVALIRSGLLTKYQAERLLAGRSEGFFLGDLKILDLLGAGGMGKVYLAEQLKLGRQVALKVLPNQLSGDEKYVARFRREAKAAAQLKHANIVQVYDVGQHGRVHYIVMELVHGKNLKERIEKQGPFSIAESLSIVSQTARGLGHAHDRGIVHRDIKPSNLVLEGETLKILDLGLARRFDLLEGVTQEGVGLGTPDYMSPEQCSDARTADAKSDIYSLGCTWYQFLSGRPPFTEVSPIAKAMAHQYHEPEPIQSRVPQVPRTVAALMHRMLAKSPADRPQNCAEILAEIGRISPDDGRSAQAATMTFVAPTPLASPAHGGTSMPTSLSPSIGGDSNTLVGRPAAGVPTLLLYLLPLMAALVLGGVYLGIEFMRDQMAETASDESGSSPVIDAANPEIDSPSNVAESATSSAAASAIETANAAIEESSGNPPSEDVEENATNPPAEETAAEGESAIPTEEIQVNPASDAEPAATLGSNSTADVTAPPREPVRWEVGRGEGQVPSLDTAWNQAGDGDTIVLADPGPFSIGPLSLSDKRLAIVGPAGEEGKRPLRPMIVVDPSADWPAGAGLWRIERGELVLNGIDLWIDVRERRENELTAIELTEADLRLVNSSITIVSPLAASRAAVRAIVVKGERPWDPAHQGGPEPLLVEVRDSLIRGARTVVEVDSLQAVVRVEGSLICGPGEMLNLFHRRPHEFEHQRLTFEVVESTVDVAGPIVTIESVLFEPTPVPLSIAASRSVLMNSTASELSPLVFWKSAVTSETLSGAIRWDGEDNVYWQRGDVFKARTPEDAYVVYVQNPDDWQRVELGADRGWRISQPRKPVAGVWHERTAAEYATYGQLSEPTAGSRRETRQFGVDAKQVPQPKPPKKS